jgi:RNA polymerase sigma-70 factor (ECF subfamily)
MESEDLVLVRRASAGDSLALDAVIRRWGPRVRRFAGRFCPAGEVLDAVQETLSIVAARIATLRAAEAFASWSFAIVRRQCAKAFSILRRDSALAWTLGVLDTEAKADDPRRALLIAELAAVMTGLPPRDREILSLRELERQTARQTAAALGIEERAVKSRLHRARRRLKDRLLASPVVRALG